MKSLVRVSTSFLLCCAALLGVCTVLSHVTFAAHTTDDTNSVSVGTAFSESIVTLRPHGYYRQASVKNDGIVKGSDLTLYSLGTSTKQHLELVEDDWYRICAMSDYIETGYTKYTNWDVDGRSTKSGAQVHVWEHHGETNSPASRQWRFLANEDGTFYVVNRNSGLYLALGGSAKDEDGTKLIQSDIPVAWDIDVVKDGTGAAQSLSSHANAQSWMAHVSDDTYVSDMTIPGTHDAGTCYTYGGISPQLSFTACQQLYVDEQLNAGVRFFDLRLGASDGSGQDPNINHGGIVCEDRHGSTLHLSDMVHYYKTFLKANPSETVLMMVSHSGGDIANQTDSLYRFIQENPGLFYTDATVPELGAVRGKIVLIRRFEPAGQHASFCPYGLNLSAWGNYNDEFVATKGLVKIADTDDAETWVQDNYSTTATNKLAYVLGSFEDAPRVQEDAKAKDKHAYVLNYTSCTKNNPFTAARNMNEKLYQNEHLQDNKADFLGIVVMDFVDARQAAQVWKQNVTTQANHPQTIAPEKPAKESLLLSRLHS